MLLAPCFVELSFISYSVASDATGASAGILLYMSLVDLIAIDFFSARMRSAGPKVRQGAPLKFPADILLH